MLSCALLGDTIRTFDQLRQERRKELKRVEALNHKLDIYLLDSLNMRAAALRPDVQRDADGLTELEFVIGMCIELGMLDRDQIQPFIQQFRNLDVDGNGRLGMDDLRVQNKLKKISQKFPGMGTSKDNLNLSSPLPFKLSDLIDTPPTGKRMGRRSLFQKKKTPEHVSRSREAWRRAAIETTKRRAAGDEQTASSSNDIGDAGPMRPHPGGGLRKLGTIAICAGRVLPNTASRTRTTCTATPTLPYSYPSHGGVNQAPPPADIESALTTIVSFAASKDQALDNVQCNQDTTHVEAAGEFE